MQEVSTSSSTVFRAVTLSSRCSVEPNRTTPPATSRAPAGALRAPRMQPRAAPRAPRHAGRRAAPRAAAAAPRVPDDRAAVGGAEGGVLAIEERAPDEEVPEGERLVLTGITWTT